MVNSRDDIAFDDKIAADLTVECKFSDEFVDYPEALDFMEERIAKIAKGEAKELIWFLEHKPLYTAGTSANDADLIEKKRFPVYDAGRGGEYTYHGPGQRVVYVMLDLSKRGKDVRSFVASLEDWIIQSLDDFNIHGERREDRVGVWVKRHDKSRNPLTNELKEDKIAALGIRLRKWVSFHGISINVEPDLEHFTGIVPCGISEHGVTSMVDLGLPVTLGDLDVVLKDNFSKIYGGDLQIID